LQVTPVADAALVYQLNRMLVQVMQHGTGRAALGSLPADLVVAGKSGTSSELRDSWFAGFSGTHLAIVWVGYDDNRPTRFTGSSGALTVWSRLMSGLQTSSWSAPLPENVAEVSIEYPTGLQVEAGCAEDVISIAVPIGSEPPMKEGCGTGPVETIIERAADWVRDIIR
jgi:penicillin-binding protein 1B